jgi:signal transduction histidine kinase
MGMASYLVFRIREADLRRAKLLHNIEYTSKMASLGRLAAGVAHEVNNPLAIINEKAGLLKDLSGLEGDSPEKTRRLRLVDSVLAQVDRCRTITHRLLGFAKRMDVKMEALRLDQLILDVISFLEKEAETRNVTIVKVFPDDFPTIRSDRGQLQQVFLNILNNAFQAVEDAGRIRIELARREPDRVSVTIEDDGCGITKEDRRHIFEPFFTTKKAYGTGLGLSITWGIVSKLGGTIEVESEAGIGTSFTVTLPIEAKPDGGAA